MNGAPSILELVTLAVALWGAILSTYLAFARQVPRVRVRARFSAERLGPIRNHTFFVVSVVNVGQRAVTIRDIEWEVDRRRSFTLELFRHSKGDELPVKVEADDELRLLFDSEAAANALAPSGSGATAINVLDASGKRSWRIEVTVSMCEEAEEEVERTAEEEGEARGGTEGEAGV